MNNDNVLWLIGQAVVLGGAGVAAYVAIVQRVTKLEVKFDAFVMLVGDKVAKSLHSPDDHLGIDHYLDDFVHHRKEFEQEDWIGLRRVCDMVINDKSTTPNEKSLASILAYVCQTQTKLK